MSGYDGFSFRGRPPLAPLARAASALASLVTFPPLRPSATAAGFLRGMAGIQRLQGGVVGIAGGAHLLALGWRPRGDVVREFAAQLFVGAKGGFGGLLGGRHRVNIPNRLGSVKWGILA